jgi:hypothetical protein
MLTKPKHEKDNKNNKSNTNKVVVPNEIRLHGKGAM